MKKAKVAVLVSLLLCFTVLAQPVRGEEDERESFGSEIWIGLTYPSGTFMNDSTQYLESWSSGILEAVTESGRMTHSLKKSIGISASYSYFFLGNFGFQLRADYIFRRDIHEDSNSEYTIDWRWNDATTGQASFDYPLQGSLYMTPLSFNLVFKLRDFMVTPTLSAGVTYMLGKLDILAPRGFGLTFTQGGTQKIEYLELLIDINDGFGSFGWNAAAGLDIKVGRQTVVSLGATYFKTKSVDIPWKVSPGLYSGILDSNISLEINEETAASITETMDPIHLKFSIIQFLAGIKVLF